MSKLPPSPTHLLLQFDYFGLGVVERLISDLDVSSLVVGGGAQGVQFDLQLLPLAHRLLVWGGVKASASGEFTGTP